MIPELETRNFWGVSGTWMHSVSSLAQFIFHPGNLTVKLHREISPWNVSGGYHLYFVWYLYSLGVCFETSMHINQPASQHILFYLVFLDLLSVLESTSVLDRLLVLGSAGLFQLDPVARFILTILSSYSYFVHLAIPMVLAGSLIPSTLSFCVYSCSIPLARTESLDRRSRLVRKEREESRLIGKDSFRTGRMTWSARTL